MCATMTVAWYWIVNHADRILSLIAIVIATVAIIDVRHLFHMLEDRDRTTEQRVQEAVVRELMTHALSFAAFFRAAQYIDFYPKEPDRDTCVTMFMGFHLQQKLAPNASKAELKELLRSTRNQVETAARGYAEMIIASEIGRFKDGWNFSDQPSKSQDS